MLAFRTLDKKWLLSLTSLPPGESLSFYVLHSGKLPLAIGEGIINQ